MNKLIEVLDFGIKELSEYSSDPEFESFVFLEEATGKKRGDILTKEIKIGEEDFLKFKGYLKKRINGEPWQYIIGKTNFLGFEIFSEKGVFIPRPETEFLVVSAIKELKKIDKPYILEIGSGTGAISIAIAYNIKDAKVVTSDISEKAVNLCKKNVSHHKLTSRIDIIRADLLNSFRNSQIFDMIISNPPYIPENDLEILDLVVKNEPSLALNGGYKGVSIINKILSNSSSKLKKGGYIFIELDISNISNIKVPKTLSCSIADDQFGRKRILHGIKICK